MHEDNLVGDDVNHWQPQQREHREHPAEASADEHDLLLARVGLDVTAEEVEAEEGRSGSEDRIQRAHWR